MFSPLSRKIEKPEQYFDIEIKFPWPFLNWDQPELWEDKQVSPASVSNHHFPTINELDLISINGLVSCLHTAALILSPPLQAYLIQVCLIRLIIDQSPRIFSGGFG